MSWSLASRADTRVQGHYGAATARGGRTLALAALGGLGLGGGGSALGQEASAPFDLAGAEAV